MRKIVYAHDKISIDAGVFFGRGVFETILIKEKPVYLKEHMDRLKRSLEVIKLERITEDEENELLNAIESMNLNNISLKITVTPLNIILTTRAVPYTKEDYKKGFNLGISNVIRNSTSRLNKIKSTCYIENILEKEKAKEDGYDDVIFLNEKGYVTETTCANLFIVKDKKIYTPKTECGLLPGIIRGKIMEKYSVLEKDITLKEVYEADSVFLTNSLMEVMKVNSIENIKYSFIDGLYVL